MAQRIFYTNRGTLKNEVVDIFGHLVSNITASVSVTGLYLPPLNLGGGVGTANQVTSQAGAYGIAALSRSAVGTYVVTLGNDPTHFDSYTELLGADFIQVPGFSATVGFFSSAYTATIALNGVQFFGVNGAPGGANQWSTTGTAAQQAAAFIAMVNAYPVPPISGSVWANNQTAGSTASLWFSSYPVPSFSASSQVNTPTGTLAQVTSSVAYECQVVQDLSYLPASSSITFCVYNTSGVPTDLPIGDTLLVDFTFANSGA